MAFMRASYEAFLKNPQAGALDEKASLNYITTLTTINNPPAIIKHYQTTQKVLKKKEEKVLSAVEGQAALCLEIETTLEFISGGGAYLPGLDDNFLSDRLVVFPVVSTPLSNARFMFNGH